MKKLLIGLTSMAMLFTLASCKGGKDKKKNFDISIDVISAKDKVTSGSGHFSVTVQAINNNTGKPLDGLAEGHIEYSMYENGYAISESKILKTPAPRSVRNNILLLLDFSNSVVQDCEGITRYFNGINHTVNNPHEFDENNLCTKLVKSTQAFIDSIIVPGKTSMEIFYFNSRKEIFSLYGGKSDNIYALKSSVERLYDDSFRNTYLKGYESTNLFGGIVKAVEKRCYWIDICYTSGREVPALSRDINPDVFEIGSLVVFTDGRELAKHVTQSELYATLNKFPELRRFTIGLGSDIDDGLLKSVGKDGFFKIDYTFELSTAFDGISSDLNAWANSFYKIDFCPTQVTGESDVTIKINDPTRQLYGEFRETVSLPQYSDFRCDLQY